MCNKVCHKTTWGAAQHILALQKKKKVKSGKTLGAMWCEECQGYHITSNVKKQCIFKTN